ncbi:signal peptide peptidase SppA [Zeaxanthinibacter sp. PT1]|uniref:signal peptide peptidase SppA n=1 Tax=Zeaxanthinibacter TaxID=561554 RepID=UPI00234B14E8|nr:signal peptide peptidase SppA [Zeaxanthinibacter sp. PT1]MDC6350051.1 signal peptide peptidase SppA [Zeaxanthinibacter sp. PT1]
MNFLRNLLASILGTLMALGIIFVMFLILVSLASAEDAVTVKKDSVLELNLEYPISDYTGNDAADPFAGLFEQNMGLDEIIHAIQVAADDDKIKGISIRSNMLMAGLSQIKAMRDALEDFKESGKFVYAYGDFYMQPDYYLASVADSVFLNPVGMMDFRGLSAEVLYLKSLQEKSGVKIEVIRHGKYKSAVEPFMSDNMSESNRQQLEELLGSLWSEMVDDIARSRQLDVTALNTIADTLGARMPEYAIANGMIDGTRYYDEYEAMLKGETGTDIDDDQNYVSMADYMEDAKKKKIYKGEDEVAVIFAQGEIFYGEGGPDIIGQEIMTEALVKAREDDDIKAVVLRVNSPGGSALVSDIIWREVELTKAVKPVVVSMGNVAASGGYYIAAGADEIFAEPTTITGSIGVFGTVPNISELAEDIGINAEQVGTNKNSVEYSLFEPMTDDFREVVQESIEEVYQTFLSRVAAGRNMSMAQVDSLAQGRVWSGVDAERLGLVDALGGLDMAINRAAELAELTEFSVKKYPKFKSGFARLMEDLGGAESRITEAALKAEIGEELYGILQEVRRAGRTKGVQARLPYSLNIK